jgi:hypothetical protein
MLKAKGGGWLRWQEKQEDIKKGNKSIKIDTSTYTHKYCNSVNRDAIDSDVADPSRTETGFERYRSLFFFDFKWKSEP